MSKASQLDKIVKTYQSLAQIPALTSTRLNNGGTVKSVWSQRNLEKGKTTKFQQFHVISRNLIKTSEVAPVDISSELLSSVSKSEKFQCVIRESDSKQFLEIWTDSNLLRCVDLKTLDVHGDVYTDIEFSALEFSPDETKVLYVAEKKPVKTEPFIKRKSEENKDDSNKGEEYVYKQDWGEQLVNRKQSVIAVYDINEDTVKIIDGLPESVCPAKPIWDPTGDCLIGIAYKTEPRKLGLIYCTNRLSTIFKLDLYGEYFELNLKDKSVKEPKISLDGRTLIWLERNAGGPHASCMALMKTDLPLNLHSKPDIVVDIVQDQIDIQNNKVFHGLYNQGFAKRCWASNRRLLISTNQKNTINSYVVNIDSGSITKLECDDTSLVIMDVKDDIVLACSRSFLRRDILLIGTLPQKEEQFIVWLELTSAEINPGMTNLVYEYLDIEHTNDDSVKKFSAIYLGPSSAPEGAHGLIVWPHGGPHSAFANYHALETSLLSTLGIPILLVNYRGSVGAGEASVNFLPGKVGDGDVKDCVLATEFALRKYPWLNKNKIGLVGGSHGGFLVTHLSGQYPEMFKVVVSRNPVIDIASMSVISDIPDWCYVEAGADYTQIGEPRSDILVRMREFSPIMHAHKVRAPTLLQIGSKDLRVPPHQALEYYHRLKANGVIVKMNLYDDNHPLGSVNNEVDNLINSILWIYDHIDL